MEVLEMKNTGTEAPNACDGLISRFDTAEEDNGAVKSPSFSNNNPDVGQLD